MRQGRFRHLALVPQLPLELQLQMQIHFGARAVPVYLPNYVLRPGQASGCNRLVRPGLIGDLVYCNERVGSEEEEEEEEEEQGEKWSKERNEKKRK